MIRIYKVSVSLCLRPARFCLLIFFISLCFCAVSYAQQDSLELKKVSEEIVKEGIEIYECVKASQAASSFLIEKLSIEEITGSITYKKAGVIFTVFLKGKPKKASARYSFSFPVPLETEAPRFDGEPRPLSGYEISLMKMHRKINRLARKRKSFFSNYDDIVLLPVFILKENFTYVYLISSTHDSSFIPFGNDYLLVFNEKAKLISKEKIHQNLIEVSALGTDTLNSDEAMASFHTHSELSAPFITATDIANLLLYREKVNWESHIVVSDEYVSFFFPERRVLEIITREEYNKMSEEKE